MNEEKTKILHFDKYEQATVNRARAAAIPETESHPLHGALGIDINAKHLNACLVNTHGNYKKSWNLKLDTQNLTSSQTLERCHKVANTIVSIAQKEKVPIVLENLDFTKKKETLREESNAYARMLSSFYYQKIRTCIKDKAVFSGIEVRDVNPALSSIIGGLKYAPGYRFSTHHGAALVLARRGLHFSERLRFHGTGAQVELLRAAVKDIVKRRKSSASHMWSYWRSLKMESSGNLVSKSARRSPRNPAGP